MTLSSCVKSLSSSFDTLIFDLEIKVKVMCDIMTSCGMFGRSWWYNLMCHMVHHRNTIKSVEWKMAASKTVIHHYHRLSLSWRIIGRKKWMSLQLLVKCAFGKEKKQFDDRTAGKRNSLMTGQDCWFQKFWNIAIEDKPWSKHHWPLIIKPCAKLLKTIKVVDSVWPFSKHHCF